MRNSLSKRLVLLALLFSFQTFPLSLLAQPVDNSVSSEKTIDCLSRECLIQLADDYFAAMVAHDTSLLPFASNAYFVENADNKPFGEGLWRTASAVPGNFKIYVPDPVAGQVGFIGMMEEEGLPIQIALRIKVMDGQIREVEHVIARNLRESSLENLQTLRPGINTIIPEDERMARHELTGIAYAYYDALNLNNGDLVPFADECERHENGMITVRPIPVVPPEGEPDFGLMGCSGQLTTGIMGYIDDIDNRRVPVADPVTGLVLGFSHFRHAMINKTIPITGVEGVTEREIPFNAFDLPAAHVYKIRDGKIHEIEAMGFGAPFNAPSGWE